jgi:hypothetical protein
VIQLMKISLTLLSDVCDYEGAWIFIHRSINYTPAQLPAVALLPVGSDTCEAVNTYLYFGRHRSDVLCRYHLSSRLVGTFQILGVIVQLNTAFAVALYGSAVVGSIILTHLMMDTLVA